MERGVVQVRDPLNKLSCGRALEGGSSMGKVAIASPALLIKSGVPSLKAPCVMLSVVFRSPTDGAPQFPDPRGIFSFFCNARAS